jgi:chromosome segregation ATPase
LSYPSNDQNIIELKTNVSELREDFRNNNKTVLSRLEQVPKGFGYLSRDFEKFKTAQDSACNQLQDVQYGLKNNQRMSECANELLIDVRSKVKSLVKFQQEIQSFASTMSWLVEQNKRIELENKKHIAALQEKETENSQLKEQVDDLRSRIRIMHSEREMEEAKSRECKLTGNRPSGQAWPQKSLNEHRPVGGGLGSKSARYG